MPIHRIYNQWRLAIKNRVIRPNPPDSPLDTRDEWSSLFDRLRDTFKSFPKEIRDYILVSAIWNHYFGHEGVDNPPYFLMRPQDSSLGWLPLKIQELQVDHGSQIQPPVLRPQPEERDRTPEPQPQPEPQGTSNEPSHPSQPRVIHEAQSLLLSIGLGDETNAVDSPSNSNEVDEKHLRQPRIQCINCGRRNHVLRECPERCQFCGNNQHYPNCPIRAALNRPRPR